MDHTAAPFVPRGFNASSQQPPTQPLTPPLIAHPHPPMHFRGGPPGYASLPPALHHHHHGGQQYHQTQHHQHHHHHHHHHNHFGGGQAAMPPPPQYAALSQPSEPPAYKAPTKLRAVANEYIPGTWKKPPHADPNATKPPGATPDAMDGQATATKPADSPTLKLNAGARPYSPSKANSGAFPATTSSAASEHPSSTSTPASAVVPKTGGPAFPATNPPEGVTTPVDHFAHSKLPVPAEAMAPADIKLSSAWNLLVDSHPIVIGIGAGAKEQSFQPVLIHQVTTMESFWRLWRTVNPPSEQVPSFTYYFFRRLINPTWEDSKNKGGGAINIALWDRDRAGLLEREQVDDVWCVTAMALAGESLPGAQVFNGAVLKIRPKTILLSLWTNTCDKEKLKPAAEQFRSHLVKLVSKQASGFAFDFFAHETPKAASDASKSKGQGAGKAAPQAAKPVRREADFKL